MNNPIITSIAIIGMPLILTGIYKCTDEVPLTHRKRLILITERFEKTLGKKAFQDILKTHRILPRSHPKSKAVYRVGQRIAEVSGRDDYNWEFVVIDSDEVNAFVLPGGKVCVFNGLFKILKDDNALAAVLGHEASHAVARHAAEKLTIGAFVNLALLLVHPDFFQLSHIFLSLGVDLPFSRKFETESDYMGLHLMAKACYDPRESPKMFSKLGKIGKNSNLKYLSTHPPTKDRIKKLNSHMSEAMKIYNENCGSIKNAWFST